MFHNSQIEVRNFLQVKHFYIYGMYMYYYNYRKRKTFDQYKFRPLVSE